MSSHNIELAQQSFFAIEYINRNIEYRSLLIEQGMLVHFGSFPREGFSTFPMKLSTMGFLIDLVQCGKNQLPLEIVKNVMPTLSELATQSVHHLQVRAMSILTIIAESGKEFIQVILDMNILDIVFPMLNDFSNSFMQCIGLQFIGVCVTGTADQTEEILNNGFLDAINRILIPQNIRFVRHFMPEHVIHRVALFSIFNIVACSRTHAEAVIESNIMRTLSAGISRYQDFSNGNTIKMISD